MNNTKDLKQELVVWHIKEHFATTKLDAKRKFAHFGFTNMQDLIGALQAGTPLMYEASIEISWLRSLKKPSKAMLRNTHRLYEALEDLSYYVTNEGLCDGWMHDMQKTHLKAALSDSKKALKQARTLGNDEEDDEEDPQDQAQDQDQDQDQHQRTPLENYLLGLIKRLNDDLTSHHNWEAADEVERLMKNVKLLYTKNENTVLLYEELSYLAHMVRQFPESGISVDEADDALEEAERLGNSKVDAHETDKTDDESDEYE